MENSAVKTAVINRLVKAESTATKEVIETEIYAHFNGFSFSSTPFPENQRCWLAQSAKIPAKALPCLLEIY